MVTNSLHNMREALESIRNLAFEVQDMNSEGDVKTSLPPKWVIDVVNSALSEPPRNCDVGTAEEQAKRFHAYCNQRVCISCDLPENRCRFAWAQMPYAEEGAEHGKA